MLGADRKAPDYDSFRHILAYSLMGNEFYLKLWIYREEKNPEDIATLAKSLFELMRPRLEQHNEWLREVLAMLNRKVDEELFSSDIETTQPECQIEKEDSPDVPQVLRDLALAAQVLRAFTAA